MNKSYSLVRKIRIGRKILEARLLKKYLPLTVSMALTRRCNLRCTYCSYPEDLRAEMGTEQILKFIDDLKSIGTEQITYTGGEPMLREDLGEIVDHTHRQGIVANINTNGLLIKNGIRKIKNASMVQISVDGPENVNAQSRAAPGAFSKIMEAIEICQANRLRVTLLTVLSKYNLDQIDNILTLAHKYKIKVVFQPAIAYRLGKKDHNPSSPEPKAYKQAINQLIDKKRMGEPAIFSSLTNLRHLYEWPRPTAIGCWASKLYCRIDSNGDLYPCGRMENRTINIQELGVAAAFRKSSPDPCQDCWCANLSEFNFIASLNVNALMNILSVNK